ncbi:MAG: inositol monophosphatase family protein [Promethearchaeota archaeon]
MYQTELKLAIKIVKDALKVINWFRINGFRSFQKLDESPVTTADIASQILIVSNIKKTFPEDLIIAEEGDTFIDNQTSKVILNCFNELHLEDNFDFKEVLNYKGSNTDRQWTIDPIDGTQGFLEGLVYAVGISFLKESDQKIAVIGIPNYNKKRKAIFIAEKGKGAKAAYGKNEFKSIKVSNQDNLEESTLCRSLHYDKPWVEEFAKLVGIKKKIQIDSMSKFCKVADGSADIYLKPIDEIHSYSWDFSPGVLIVKEAGGKISDLNGAPVRFLRDKLICDAPGLVASNSNLHFNIIENLRKFKF